MAKEFDEIRNQFMGAIKSMFEASKYDVLRTGSQELCIPVVNENGDEGYIVLTFKVPKGSRDGEPYDGYEVAQDYQMKCEEKERKAKIAAEKKAKKIERDKKLREEKAKLKAERNAKGEK